MEEVVGVRGEKDREEVEVVGERGEGEGGRFGEEE